jgi:hypothetical protein
VRAIDADHQHRGQRRNFDRDPHQADVVRHEGEVHAEHHGLVHGVVEAEIDWRQSSGIEFVRNVACAEDAGGEAHEGVEHDEDDVEVVNQDVGPRLRTFDGEQRERGKKGQKACNDVQPRRQPIAGQGGQ